MHSIFWHPGFDKMMTDSRGGRIALDNCSSMCYLPATWRMGSQDLDTWLGSPPFISHGKVIWKENKPA